MLFRRLRRLAVFACLLVLTAGCSADELDAVTPTCTPQCVQYVTTVIAGQAAAYNHYLAGVWYGALIASTQQAQCVRSKESDSAGGYSAQNRISSASGAYQFLNTTGDNVNRAMGSDDLVGLPARLWPAYRQDLAFGYLWNASRGQAWAGECGSAPIGG